MPEPMTDEQVLAALKTLPSEHRHTYAAYVGLKEERCTPEEWYLSLAVRDLAAALMSIEEYLDQFPDEEAVEALQDLADEVRLALVTAREARRIGE
jgi:hypothetical protein